MENNKTNTTNFKGFDCGSLNLISGVRAMGLTSLAINIAGKSDCKKVLYFSLEELKEHIENRLEKLNYTANNIEIIDSVSDIDGICEIIKNRKEIDMVVIDKLSLIRAESNDLCYVIFAIFSFHIGNYFIAFFIAKINIKVRKRNTFRI